MHTMRQSFHLLDGVLAYSVKLVVKLVFVYELLTFCRIGKKELCSLIEQFILYFNDLK
jgi:hypothetical protein